MSCAAYFSVFNYGADVKPDDLKMGQKENKKISLFCDLNWYWSKIMEYQIK
jgi:hypothetical protein